MQSAGTETTWFYDLLAWAQAHSKQVIAGGVGLLVVIVAGYVVAWERHQQALSSNHALFAAAQPASPDEKPSVSALLQVADQYPGTSVAERALLLAAGRAYEEGNYAEAEKHFRAHREQFPDSLFAPIAALGVASSLDAQDKVDEAVTAYEQTIATWSHDPVADRARLALATLYEDQDQPADALRVYDQMTDSMTFSEASFQATTRRQQLLAQHPELAPEPTNAPPAAAVAPVTTNAPAATSNVVAGATNAVAVTATNVVEAAANAAAGAVSAATNAAKAVPAPPLATPTAPATNAPADGGQ